MKRSTLIAALAASAIATSAAAIPRLDDGVAFVDLATGSGETRVLTLFRDDVDPDLYYWPYERIRLATDETGLPVLGFAYTQSGAMLSFTVEPSIDAALLEEAQRKALALNPRARFAPVPIKRGTWSLAIAGVGSEATIEASDAIVDDALANPWSAQVAFDRPMADLIVAALTTGAVFGVNYSYVVPTTVAPSTVRLSFHRARLVDALGDAGRQTERSLARASDQLIGRGILRIDAVGEDAPLSYALVFAVDYLRTTCYRRQGPAASPGYAFDEDRCTTNVPDEIIIQSGTRRDVVFTAGFSVGGMCNTHPELFAYSGPRGSIRAGCPDRTLPPRGAPITDANVPRALSYAPAPDVVALPDPQIDAGGPR